MFNLHVFFLILNHPCVCVCVSACDDICLDTNKSLAWSHELQRDCPACSSCESDWQLACPTTNREFFVKRWELLKRCTLYWSYDLDSTGSSEPKGAFSGNERNGQCRHWFRWKNGSAKQKLRLPNPAQPASPPHLFRVRSTTTKVGLWWLMPNNNQQW